MTIIHLVPNKLSNLLDLQCKEEKKTNAPIHSCNVYKQMRKKYELISQEISHQNLESYFVIYTLI